MTDNVFFFLKHKNDVHFFYDCMSLDQALSMMRAHGYTAVPVIACDGTYQGSVSEGDFLWFLKDHYSQPELLEATTLREIIRDGFMPALKNTVSFDELLDHSLHQNYVPIVDDRNIFIGIVTRQAILNYFLEQKRAIAMVPTKSSVEIISTSSL